MPSLGSVARTLIACFKIGHTACDLLLISKSTRDSISFPLHYVLTFPAMRERLYPWSIGTNPVENTNPTSS
jgi:phage regulator Rha-like protein